MESTPPQILGPGPPRPLRPPQGSLDVTESWKKLQKIPKIMRRNNPNYNSNIHFGPLVYPGGASGALLLTLAQSRKLDFFYGQEPWRTVKTAAEEHCMSASTVQSYCCTGSIKSKGSLPMRKTVKKVDNVRFGRPPP